MRSVRWTLILLSTSALMISAGSLTHAQKQSEPAEITPLPGVAPAPHNNPTTAAKAALGKQLFFDPRLSGDNKTSCATCHRPDHGFADSVAKSRLGHGKELPRNTQSCLNVGFLQNLFWDGRARCLEQQALIPLVSPTEMNQDIDELERELARIPAYAEQFESIFGNQRLRVSIAAALSAYQRTLITTNAPFDRFLQGDRDAISADARAGWELFRGAAGCIECHHGPLLSDEKYYRLGVSFRDAGLAAVSHDEADRGRFRTPPLRNVAETAPYMHDGSMRSLDEVVTFYYRGVPSVGPDGVKPDIQALSGQSFSEIPQIVAFLESLTGTIADSTPPLLPGLLSSSPTSLISPSWTDDEGMITHRVSSPLQTAETEIRVLLPEPFDPTIESYPVVYVLPVEAAREHRYGDGLQTIRALGLHKQYRAVFVAPSFAKLPWYVDHPTHPAIAQERYFLNVVVPYIELVYPVSQRPQDRMLLGFSKSGWGAWSLALRHPERFGRAAAWDTPFMLNEIGPYGTTEIFATQDHMTAQALPNRLSAAASVLRDRPLFVLAGGLTFRHEHEEMAKHLDTLGIPFASVHHLSPPQQHTWDGGWLKDTVRMLLDPDAFHTEEDARADTD